MADFEFTRREGEPLLLSTAVHEALGRASTCWESLTHSGVFDDATATDIGAKLIKFVHEREVYTLHFSSNAYSGDYGPFELRSEADEFATFLSHDVENGGSGFVSTWEITRLTRPASVHEAHAAYAQELRDRQALNND